MNQEDILIKVHKELCMHADENVKKSGERFFKESVKMYGIKTVEVTKIAKKYFFEIKSLPKKEIWDLCDELWQSGVMEKSFIACNWSYALRNDYAKSDMKVFEKWVKNHVTNWASCDTLCNHTIGTLVEKYPEHITQLKKWAVSKNRWMRRAAAVTLIVPARKGLFLDDIFKIADLLLEDSDDMVQKGYGWMLKVASQKYEKEVFEYVMKNKEKMPRTALRYAIEKMSKELKVRAMAR